VSVALIVGYLSFGRFGDYWTRRGRSLLPLFAGAVAGALTFFALITLGVTVAPVLLWAGLVFFGSGASLAHSIATRRYPRDMAGRVNTALNTFTFVGIFLGQWATGAILALWPPTPGGYDPHAYFYGFGALWLVQACGLVWLWSGRKVFR
jgi:MFS family permease